jgi:HNH endonuclease
MAEELTAEQEARQAFEEMLDEKDYCLGCGKYVDDVERIEIDHIAPKSRGGRDERSNYQPLCKSYNKKKSASYIDFRPAFMLGFELGMMAQEIHSAIDAEHGRFCSFCPKSDHGIERQRKNSVWAEKLRLVRQKTGRNDFRMVTEKELDAILVARD